MENENNFCKVINCIRSPKCAQFVFLKETCSTNDFIRKILRKESISVVLAENQTKARGRFDHVWESSSKNNFYGSFGFEFFGSFEQIRLLPIWLSHQLCKTFNKKLNSNLQTKWPNDLVFDGKKFGGILVESIVLQNSKFLIIGIGININSLEKDFSEKLRNKSTSLREIFGKKLNFKDICQIIISCVLQEFYAFFKTDINCFLANWESIESKFGHNFIIYQEKQKEINGIQRFSKDEIFGKNSLKIQTKIVGLNKNSHLILEDPISSKRFSVSHEYKVENFT